MTLTLAERGELVARRLENGETLAAISGDLGFDRGVVRRWVVAARGVLPSEVRPRCVPITDDQRERMAQAYADGASCRAIAEELGLADESRVRRELHRMGVQRRALGRPARG